MEELFERALNETAAQKVFLEKLCIEIRGEFYSLYKQITEGDNKSLPPPQQKLSDYCMWEAWEGKKGLSKENAIASYIALAKKVLPKGSAAKLY